LSITGGARSELEAGAELLKMRRPAADLSWLCRLQLCEQGGVREGEGQRPESIRGWGIG
jgi:hypothetical protein